VSADRGLRRRLDDARAVGAGALTSLLG
jgi:hypothetical protein